MSIATGTIFTFGDACSLGNCVDIQVRSGLSGVAVKITGTYVGVLAVEFSADHGGTWTQVDTITSEKITKCYTFPASSTYLVTDFRVRGTSWTSGEASITIEPWQP
jgi:hypothetical protein